MSSSPTFTLGVEEEFQIVDRVTRELKYHIQEIFEDGELILKEYLKPEMHQSVVETGTGVCKNVKEAKSEVFRLRSELAKLALKNDLRIAAAGTHPFSHWKDQRITDHPRYKQVVDDMQLVARANLIFGLHVHVGVEDRETAIHIMNAARYFLPHIFALSTNSPFWVGRNTGFRSYRVKVFDRFPRTGIPDYFMSIGEYDNYVNLLIKTNCIDNAKKIWWDLRVHPFFNTVEFRVCDIPLTVDETITLAALFQAICARIYMLRSKNLNFIQYSRALLNENKWRASRYGVDGYLIDFGKEEEVNTRALIYELLDFLDPVLDHLGSRHRIANVHRILEHGTGADRQLAVFEQTKNLTDVAKFIHGQYLAGI